ncbi:MAG: SIS domain-containing protein [Betaproteobacteria bacterium]|nr:SIS domain-containing protein [Betaproteobacteria bacterium]MDH5262756.1 SIS domain-containing protein [Gammaproteobacteria bacterium]
MLTQIQHRLPDLSRAEQRVARWVLDHPRRAAKSKLAGVAMACRTSEPTVIRFCRHLGLAGFRDFTLRLTESLSHPAIYVHRDVSKDDTAVDAVSKVMDASIRSLIEVRARATSMPFEDAVAAMLTARQIVFVGLGASGHVASDACHKFFRLGIPCSALTDLPTCLQFAAIANRDDVVVIASRSGRSRELQRIAKLARENGAIVIAITEPDSGLAAGARLVFPCHSAEDSNVYTPMSSRLAHLALLDALHVALALAMGEPAVENLRRAKEAILRSADIL